MYDFSVTLTVIDAADLVRSAPVLAALAGIAIVFRRRVVVPIRIYLCTPRRGGRACH